MSTGDEVPDAAAVAEVALELFAQGHREHHPLGGSAIARALGVSPQALFTRYGWLAGLGETVDGVVLAEVAAALAEAPRPGDPADALAVVRALASALRELADARPDLAIYLRHAFAHHRSLAGQLLQHVAGRLEDELARSGGAVPADWAGTELASLVLAPVLLARAERPTVDSPPPPPDGEPPWSFTMRVGDAERHGRATVLRGRLLSGDLGRVPRQVFVDNRRTVLTVTVSESSWWSSQGISLTVTGASVEELGTAAGRLAWGHQSPPRPAPGPTRLEFVVARGAELPLRQARGRLYVDELPLSGQLIAELLDLQRTVDAGDGGDLPEDVEHVARALLSRVREELGLPRFTVTSAQYDEEHHDPP